MSYFVSAGIEAVEGTDLAHVERELAILVAATVKEPGCIRFEIRQNLENLRRFVLWEEWTGPEALADHFRYAHTERVIGAQITRVIYNEKLGEIGARADTATLAAVPEH
ncbi:putative quinol monooxygenase [Pseudooceanicola sp. C21-150M6]|uniref:putative quinol monooxygenase n=1 Tax=Pseudooceanicola sp. C21-150M6 TaxID=3434355 RepID=UPI003D7F224E